mgnify:FL=1
MKRYLKSVVLFIVLFFVTNYIYGEEINIVAILVASFVLPAVSALAGRILGNNRHEDKDSLQK